MGRGDNANVLSPSVWLPLKRARLLGSYVVGLAATAAGLFTFLVFIQLTWSPNVSPHVFAWPGFIMFLAVGIFAERFTVRIGPGMEVSAGFLALFLSAAIVGPLGSFVVAIASQVWLLRRSDWQRGLCFLSAVGIAAGGSGLFYWALVAQLGSSEIVVAGCGLLAGVLFQVVNYAVFVPVMWLRRGLGPRALWMEGFQPFLPFHFFFLSISLGLIYIYRLYILRNPEASVIYSTLLVLVCLLPVMGLIYAFRAFAHERELSNHNARLALRNERLALQAVASQVTALDLKDNYTARHSAAVAQWATDIAERMKLTEHEVNVTHLASLMHDVGKIGIPDDVLNATGKLDPVAWSLVETHCRNGEKILNNIDEFGELAKVVLYHHERYDGAGYPEGVEGEDIPLLSRIICVADSYSAMVSDRPYRKRLSTTVAKSELEVNKGKQFDPGVVDCFLELLEEHGEDYQRGEKVDFLVEFQKVRFLRELPSEAE